MADILADALKPYLGPGVFVESPDYNTFRNVDRTQFSPDYSLGLMREYNKAYNLGLTDSQIAEGIKAFGDRHKSQFGVNLSSMSNPVAVAAESIERALATAGKDPGPFWAKASPYLAQGEDMAQQNWNNTFGQTQTGQRAELSQGEDWFGDLVMTVTPLIMSAAVGGAFSPGGMFGGTAGATAAGEAASGGFIDALGGMTDITGTALPGWSSGASALGTGGSNMGIFDDLLSQFTDVPVGQPSGWDFGPNLSDFTSPSGWDFGPGSIGDGGWNFGPGNIADIGIDNVSGMTLDGLSGSALPDWLKNAPDTVKKLFSSSVTGATGTGTGGGSLLGAGLGGLAGLLGGAKQAGTTDVTQTPWGPQQPFLLDAWAKAKAASEANNPIQSQANSNFQSVLQGPTKNPMLGLDNPYLQTQIDNANNDVTRAMMPAMIQANKASGSFGNSGVADIYGKAMTDAYSKNANDMRYKDYYAQQQLQKDAVGNTLGFTTGSSAFNAAPAQDYAKTVQGSYGGTTSSPYFTNPASSMLGGATLGYNLFGGK